MGLFGFLGRRRRREPPNRTERVPDTGKRLTKFPELRDAWVSFQTEELSRAQQIASHHTQSGDPELRLEATKIVALVHFRQGRYQQALELFEHTAANSSDAGDWFNVATAATMTGNIEKGNHAFGRAVRCQEVAGASQEPSLPFMRYYYACALRDKSEYRRALTQIEKLREIYEQLKITDDTFVYIRGVPFLSHTMSVAMDVFRGLPELDWRAWIDGFAQHLDEDGKAYLASCAEKLAGQPQRREYLIKRTDGERFDLHRDRFSDVLRPSSLRSEPVPGWGDYRIQVKGVEVSFSYEDAGIHVVFDGNIDEMTAARIAREVSANITEATGQSGQVVAI